MSLISQKFAVVEGPANPPLHRERLYDASGTGGQLHVRLNRPLPFGANLRASGVSYRIWCPNFESLTIVIKDERGNERMLHTARDEGGYQCAHDDHGRAGDRYLLRLPNQEVYPDPASRGQDTDVRGYSVVVDPHAYSWRDQQWQRPAFRDLVIYELHIGTFTPEGTFAAAIGKLPALMELGINAIELMPIADFPGGRNWGYDGVLLYAPARAYGSPDDLRALVDAAHAHGLAVILDVVYNHVGPDGSCLAALAPQYFNDARKTPWGSSFNFDGPDSQPVREYFASNPVYWMKEFHMDGVRLDATHAIADQSPVHILAEISDRVHALGGYVIGEDERNEVKLVEPRGEGGFGLDAVWADDFHHSVRVSQTNEQHAYLQNFSGTLEETVDTLRCGWRFRG
ncbi:MAG TPA: alpha-amylase family glycosyl hydrolase, partial [Prosthecobacter sp.]|nr:alpha-amylase family glycosyl hydrolase [Prosthecobacter sp.]